MKPWPRDSIFIRILNSYRNFGHTVREKSVYPWLIGGRWVQWRATAHYLLTAKLKGDAKELLKDTDGNGLVAYCKIHSYALTNVSTPSRNASRS